MLKIVRKRIAKLPNYGQMPDPFWRKVEQISAVGIVDNVLRQQQEDGSPLKRNAPSTRKRKQKLGRGVRSLIHKLDRFVQTGFGSFKAERRGKNRLFIVPATEELKNIVRWVQEKGYTGWFGHNKETDAALGELLRRELKRMWRAAARRQGGR